MRALRPALLALGCAACGTLATPSRGDVDNPTSPVGPFQALTAAQTPAGNTALLRADQGDVDEPSVLTLSGHRVAFLTWTTGSSTQIGVARERGMAPGGLDFTSVQSALTAQQSWEQGSVRSPSAFALEDGSVLLAYASPGGLGLARSPDGARFTNGAAPLLVQDATRGERGPLEAPSLLRLDDGSWLLAYASAGILLAARASSPDGPWTRDDAILAAPRVDSSADAGVDGGPAGFEAVSLGDPSLAAVPTTTGRTLYLCFYTARGAAPGSSLGLLASYDARSWARSPRPVLTDRAPTWRAGSLDRIDSRTALLWVGTGSTPRVGTAALGPILPRVSVPSH